MKILLSLVLMSVTAVNAPRSWASDSSSYELGLSSSFLMSKEQAKSSVGASNGALYTDQQLGLWASILFPIGKDFSLGGFLHFEHGDRENCGYSQDASGTPTPASCQGGVYNQFWLGPSIKWTHKNLFIEAHYVLYGTRYDSAYPTLTAGDARNAVFQTHPFKAWVFTPGAFIELSENLRLNLKLEYRFLYYSKRGGKKLPANQQFGTQAIRPQIGVSWMIK